MDTQPKIPTLKDSQKPQVKVRGLQVGATLFDRLKQFKKKDLAFILAGLGVLFMAPLAEHFMMSPEVGDGTLQQGWGKGSGGRGMFDGSGSSPYEPGTTGLAPGSAVGGGSDIITPLNVRDPSALVMGPGATQQPPTSSVMPATPPPTAPATHSDSDLKDALAASARGVGAAARAVRSLLPVPKIALAGSGGLRGLGVVSGGTSAVAGGPISSNGLVSGRASNPGNLGGVTGAKGVTGVTRGQTSGGGGALDALKAAGDKAAAAFNHPGANSGLNEAANTAIPNGGGSLGGNGAGGTGSTDKPFGGDQNKDGKNVGESLAFLKQKAIQEAQIALWAKEQEAGDNKLEALKIRNSSAEAFASGLVKLAVTKVGCVMGSGDSTCPGGPGGATTFACTRIAPPNDIMLFKAGSVSTTSCSTPAGSKDGAPAASTSYYYDGVIMNTCQGTAPVPLAQGCKSDGSTPTDGDKSKTEEKGAIKNEPLGDPKTAGTGVISNMGTPPVSDLGGACDNLTKFQNDLNPVPNKSQELAKALALVPALLAQAKMIVEVRDNIGNASATGPGGNLASSGQCKANLTDIKIEGSDPVSVELYKIAGPSGSLTASQKGILDRMNKLATSMKKPDASELSALSKDVGDGEKSGATGDMATLIKNAETINSNWKPDTNLMTGDPLNMAVLGQQFKGFFSGDAAAKEAAGVSSAVTTIQRSANIVGQSVALLNTAANADLKPQIHPLQASAVGDNATIPALVKVNQALDAVGGAGTTGMKVPPPLTKPTLNSNQRANGMTPEQMFTPLRTADQDITDETKGAAALVKAYGAQKTPATDCASNDACNKAQNALNTAGKDVSTVQSAQWSIDESIRTAATAAWTRMSGAPK